MAVKVKTLQGQAFDFDVPDLVDALTQTLSSTSGVDRLVAVSGALPPLASATAD